MASYVKPVVFNLGEQYYGVDINSVMGIERELSIVSVPNSVSYVKGIINLRGEVIPVLNLRKKFCMKDDEATGQNLIVVKVNNVKVALDVDSVNEISDMDPSKIFDMPSIIKADDVEYFDRVANHNGKIIVLIDIDKLLTAAEQKAMQNIADENRRR